MKIKELMQFSLLNRDIYREKYEFGVQSNFLYICLQKYLALICQYILLIIEDKNIEDMKFPKLKT